MTNNSTYDFTTELNARAESIDAQLQLIKIIDEMTGNLNRNNIRPVYQYGNKVSMTQFIRELDRNLWSSLLVKINFDMFSTYTLKCQIESLVKSMSFIQENIDVVIKQALTNASQQRSQLIFELFSQFAQTKRDDLKKFKVKNTISLKLACEYCNYSNNAFRNNSYRYDETNTLDRLLGDITKTSNPYYTLMKMAMVTGESEHNGMSIKCFKNGSVKLKVSNEVKDRINAEMQVHIDYINLAYYA